MVLDVAQDRAADNDGAVPARSVFVPVWSAYPAVGLAIATAPLSKETP